MLNFSPLLYSVFVLIFFIEDRVGGGLRFTEFLEGKPKPESLKGYVPQAAVALTRWVTFISSTFS